MAACESQKQTLHGSKRLLRSTSAAERCLTTTGDIYTWEYSSQLTVNMFVNEKRSFYLNVEGSEACDDLEQVVSQKQVPGGHKSKNSTVHCEIARIALELDL